MPRRNRRRKIRLPRSSVPSPDSPNVGSLGGSTRYLSLLKHGHMFLRVHLHSPACSIFGRVGPLPFSFLLQIHGPRVAIRFQPSEPPFHANPALLEPAKRCPRIKFKVGVNPAEHMSVSGSRYARLKKKEKELTRCQPPARSPPWSHGQCRRSRPMRLNHRECCWLVQSLHRRC